MSMVRSHLLHIQTLLQLTSKHVSMLSLFTSTLFSGSCTDDLKQGLVSIVLTKM